MPAATALTRGALCTRPKWSRCVRRHIRGLPPKLRDALLLAAAGDLTQEELAAAMNIPAATFRGRVRDARLRLKKKLG